MKQFKEFCIYLVIITLGLLFVLTDLNAKPIILKFGTVAPRGTSVSIAVEMLQNMFNYEPFQDLMGQKVKYKVYWGAIQGDEPQMIQKAKMGQLDCISITPMGLPLVCKQIEPLMMAYLLTDYGEFDYVIFKLRKYINNLYYKNGWIVMNLATTEGRHYLFCNGPYRTPEQLRKNLVAGNYSGAADDTFYNALDVPQTAVQVSDAFMMYKQGLLSGGIAPALMSVGMQMYVNQKYMILPAIRMVPNSFGFPKRRYDKLPWELKAYYIVTQPFMYFGGGVLQDSDGAFYDSLLKVGIKEVKLSDAELKVWKDKVMAYRKIYLGDDKQKNELYNMVMKAKEEYKKNNLIEKKIFLDDPRRSKFSKKMREVGKAIQAYQKNGSLTALKSLEKKKIIENWRIYGWVSAAEHYIKTKKPNKLKKWMKSFFVDEVVDELFSKHIDVVKKLFGSRKSVSAILGSYRIYLEFPRYKGFQKKGFSVKKR